MDTQLHKIAMIVVYFGKAPWYLPFFLSSCRNNKTIDFYFVTDFSLGDDVPENVRTVTMTMAEMKTLASDNIGVEVALDNPYKLCDLKPCYGLIFQHLLEGYDFWGYGDVDLIFGDIRSFYTPEVLNGYDVFSAREQYLTGFFTLMRNTPRLLNIFRESRDYKKVLQSHINYCFDETNWRWMEVMEGISVFQLKTEIEHMTYVIKKQALCEKMNTRFETIILEDLKDTIEWENGRLTCKGKQLLLFHLIQFKELPYFHIPKWVSVPERMFIKQFYFSSYPAGELAAIRERIKLVLTRFFHLQRRGLRFYFNWLTSCVRAGSIRKRAAAIAPERLTGVYTAQDGYELEVKYTGRDLTVNRQGYPAFKLLHLDGDKFLFSRYKVAGFVNVRLQFCVENYDSGLQMKLSPANATTTTFFRTSEPGAIAKAGA